MAEGQARVGAEGVADPPLSTGVRGHKKIENYSQKGALCTFFLFSFFLSYLGWHTLSSYHRMPVLRSASQAGPMRNPREGTSVLLRDTIRRT